VTRDGHVKLGDFGIAVPIIYKARRGTLAGSPYWMAPEVSSMRESGYDCKADIWSFGIALYELLTGNPPNWQMEAAEAIETTSISPPRLPAGFSKATSEFVHSCLKIDPAMRPSAGELLKGKYFRGVKTHIPRSPLLKIVKTLKLA